jgi:hypothetical protein
MRKKIKLSRFLWVAVFFGFLFIGVALGAKIFAETMPLGTTNISGVSCDYKYSEWSQCNSYNYQIRSVLSKSPDGCNSSLVPPVLKQSCSYNSFSAKCLYTYSAWSACNSSRYQTRSVLSKSPDGCNTTLSSPILKQTCNYIPETTSTTSDNSSAEQESSSPCSYIYSEWSRCDSSGYQTRTIKAKTPEGCVISANPILKQSCAYSDINIIPENGTSNTATTPRFNFLNIKGGEVISGSVNIQGTVAGASGVEFYLIQKDSNTPKFLGQAKYNQQKAWEYSFDSTNQPNGTFDIVPKVKNIYGTYFSDKRMIIILNPVADEASVQPHENENRTNSEWQERYFKSPDCLDISICGGEADPDMDGLSNNEEYRLGIDPLNPDSDQDGFLDGDEIKNGFNPLKASPGDKSDKMVFENPKESGEIKKDLYKIETVELVQTEDGKNKLKMSGKAMPNTFITLYIFSDPIVLTVKTDNDGNWSYELDKDIEDGNHEVYIAITDNIGKITAKSELLAFVKTAEAVTVIPPAEAAVAERAASPTEVWYKKGIFSFIIIVIAGLALAFASVGIYKYRISKKNETG